MVKIIFTFPVIYIKVLIAINVYTRTIESLLPYSVKMSNKFSNKL